MSDVSRACVRCRRAAVVARGHAGYCLECNEIMDWSDVIAVVQNVGELGPAAAPVTPAVPPAGAATSEPVREPALSGGGGDPTGSDPFARRLI